MESNEELGERLLAAMLAADGDRLRAVCSPDVEIVLNQSPVLGREWLTTVVGEIVRVMPDYHYENVRCSATSDGFVHERDAVGTLADGTDIRGSGLHRRHGRRRANHEPSRVLRQRGHGAGARGGEHGLAALTGVIIEWTPLSLLPSGAGTAVVSGPALGQLVPTLPIAHGA